MNNTVAQVLHQPTVYQYARSALKRIPDDNNAMIAYTVISRAGTFRRTLSSPSPALEGGHGMDQAQ